MTHRSTSRATLLVAVVSLLAASTEGAPWIQGTTFLNVPIGGTWLWVYGTGFEAGMTMQLAATGGTMPQPNSVTVLSASFAVATFDAVPASLDGSTVYGVGWNPDGTHTAKTLLGTVSDGAWLRCASRARAWLIAACPPPLSPRDALPLRPHTTQGVRPSGPLMAPTATR